MEHLSEIASGINQAADDVVQRMREEVGIVGRLPCWSPDASWPNKLQTV